MTPLGERLIGQIRADGPISVAQYMALALGHPTLGYYTTRDPLGAAGDFTTAPEISQMFGELIGLWCASAWDALGRPDRIVLAELGPGRGTLMADLLRAARIMPGFLDAAEVWMVETSPALAARQRALLGERPRWTGRVADLPEAPLLLVANEFFDALPVRQFVRVAGGWRERMVGLAPSGDALAFALAPTGPGALADRLPAGAPEGAVAELSPDSEAIVALVAARLAAHGGAALIVDYGPAESGLGDSFQAVKGHAFADPLAEPGAADLTAHVDFARLAAAARTAGAGAWGPVTQGALLQALGIGARAERLAAAGPDAARAVAAALARLTAPDHMGSLFKALALTGPGAGPPAGFPAG
jgi:NADH dehydrogenase [ubiquinone] 1 alpha subcomplex assembly factor 7